MLRQEDKVVAFLHVQGVDDPAEEGFPGVGVLALRLADRLEEPVLVTVRDLLGGEDDVYQVFPQRAGECLFQQCQIHLLLLRLHEAKGGVDPGDDLLIAVDIAAEDF